MPATSNTAPVTRLRPNPCLTSRGEPRGRKTHGSLARLLEGQLRALPLVLLSAFALWVGGAIVLTTLGHLAGEDAVGVLVIIWLIVGVGAFLFWADALRLATFGLLVLGASALTAMSQLARGAEPTIEAWTGVAGRALLITVIAMLVLGVARAWENRATGGARRAAWALELVTLFAAAAAFALVLPVAWPSGLGALAVALLLLAPEVLALVRGEERKGRLVEMTVLGEAHQRTTARVPREDEGRGGTLPSATPRVAVSGIATTGTTTPQAAPPTAKPERLDDLLAELDSYPGLAAVKKQVRELVAFLQVQRAREQEGMKAASATAHLRFEGPPGTGKTEMARLIARILAALGVVERGHLVEVDRSKLVGKYQGHTADAVGELCDEALGGVLFIDEAYSLFGGHGDSFGAEAVNTLIARMENDREGLVVILAGYPREMAELLDSNPGLRSRVQRVLTFPEYPPDELLAIARRFAERNDYDWGDDAVAELRQALAALYAERDANWGNAREVRKLYEAATLAQAVRLSEGRPDKQALRTLDADDVRAAVEQYRAERDADRAGQRQVQSVFPAF